MTSMPGTTLWRCFEEQGARIAARAFEGISTRADWETQRPILLRQFMRSVGLDPLPARGDLDVTDHGRFGGEGYCARKISYRLLPDCWATGAVYSPEPLGPAPRPAVLYACGHSACGVDYYQPHAAMWARRGYVCLVFDTIEQADNPGDHHGLHGHGRFDWLSLGYSAAGGELWNSIRALDVLASLPEVDPDRIGATGTSGGGAHSFFLAIADSRVKAAAASCGVASPLPTIRDRHIPDHCDCIYFHNPYGRDTSEFAALVAPRPLLFSFAAQDPLFSSDEIHDLAERTRRIYRLLGCEENCRLFEYPGPHGYKPESVQSINEWFDRHVAGEPHPALALSKPDHTETVTSVFNGRPPAVNRTALLPELLTPAGSVPLPRTAEEWPAIRAEAIASLRRDVFPRLHEEAGALTLERRGDWLNGGTRFRRYAGQLDGVDVWMEVSIPSKETDKVIVGCANLGESSGEVMRRLAVNAADGILAAIEPRGTGHTAWHPQRQTDILRAGALLGITPVSLLMQDIARMLGFLRGLPEFAGKRVSLFGRGDAGVACLYHAILDDDVAGVVAEDAPGSHRQGGHILGILRVMDIQHAVGLLAPRPVALVNMGPAPRMFWAERLYSRLGCPEKLIDWNLSLQTALRHVVN